MEFSLEELINDINSYDVIAEVITETVEEGDGYMSNTFTTTYIDGPIYLTDGIVKILLEGEFAKLIGDIVLSKLEQ